jgi:hypothetical protein
MIAFRLAALCAVPLLLAVPLLAVNEEVVHRLDVEARLDTAIAQNMTLESSLHILQNMPGLHPDVLSFVQESLSSHHHHKRHGHHHRLRHREVQQVEEGATTTAAPATGKTGYAAVATAVQDVSTQLAQSQQKWDVENARCCKQRAAAEEALEALDEGIALANGQASTAQAAILKANKKIAENENKIPEEKDSMRTLREQCKSDKISIDKDLAITFENLDGLDNMEMTSCDGKAALLQCEHPSSGESFLMLDHHTMKKSASQWQHHAVQTFLKALSTPTQNSEERPVSLVQLEGHTDPQKCTMEANPECQQIRDRYMLMTSDMEDNMDELHEKMKGDENECEQNIKSIEENINNAMLQLKATQTALAEATADLNQAMEASRLKNEERDTHVKEMKSQAKQCHDAKGTLLDEKQALLKVRGEMLTMKGLKVFIQDCKVSDWTPGDCSKSCGGGMRSMKRDILAPKQGDGAICGLLVAEEACNTQKCPINCEMGEWGGWSACSAKCGGGVAERVRDIKRHAAHGGKPCLAAQDTQSCNPQSCDANCELYRWSPWSKCSKACDKGTTMRVRRVRKPSEGQGTCPGKFSRNRLRMKACNKKACLTEKDEDKSLQCNSKRDVVLLIDGSASLRNSGWDAVKKASAAIVKSMGKDVDLAAVLYSGPKTRKDYFKCSGQLWPNRKTGTPLGAPDIEKDCLVSWVRHFTNDKAKMTKSIEAMKWPRGSTLTSEALAMAETELNNGRRDAQAVVVVVTDGKPMNKRKVEQVVGRLRKKARLMWVAVSTNAPTGLIKKWASVPWQENVVFAKNFKELVSKDTTNAIVANMCPTMELV